MLRQRAQPELDHQGGEIAWWSGSSTSGYNESKRYGYELVIFVFSYRSMELQELLNVREVYEVGSV